MQKITSRDNQKLKFARKTRDGIEKSFIFVEGARLAEELLQSDLKIFQCFVSENFSQNESNQKFLYKISNRTKNLSQISDKIFDSLSDTKTSQGVILIAEKPEHGKNKIEKIFYRDFENFPFLVLLHQINNPSNLGAILRTAEAVGVPGVILTKNSADVFSPKSLRSAMGAAFRLNFWTNADFDEILFWAREKNLKTVCADINAEKSFWEVDWIKPTLLIFGSEAHGLTDEERGKVDEGIFIPMEAGIESLNLAVSCGIILFEAKRNRTKKSRE